MGRDNAAISGGNYCHRSWQTTTGFALCTRPAFHGGPCVDRIQNITEKEQPK